MIHKRCSHYTIRAGHIDSTNNPTHSVLMALFISSYTECVPWISITGIAGELVRDADSQISTPELLSHSLHIGQAPGNSYAQQPSGSKPQTAAIVQDLGLWWQEDLASHSLPVGLGAPHPGSAARKRCWDISAPAVVI